MTRLLEGILSSAGLEDTVAVNLEVEGHVQLKIQVKVLTITVNALKN